MSRRGYTVGTFTNSVSLQEIIHAAVLEATSILWVSFRANTTRHRFGYLDPDMTHGAPDAEVRHIGDLGNFEANEFGVGFVATADTQITLVGPVKNSPRHPLPAPPSRRPRLGRHVSLPRLGREVEVEHCCRSRSRVGSSHKRSGSLGIG